MEYLAIGGWGGVQNWGKGLWKPLDLWAPNLTRPGAWLSPGSTAIAFLGDWSTASPGAWCTARPGRAAFGEARDQHMGVSKNQRGHVYTCMYGYVYIYICVSLCSYRFIHILHICIRIRMHMYVHMYKMNKCRYIHMYVYIHIEVCLHIWRYQ